MQRSLISEFSYGIFFIVLIGFASCVSPQKAIYFNDLQPSFDSINYDLLEESRRIQPGDRVSISIITKEQEANGLFNAAQQGGGNTGMGNGMQGGFGYLVQSDGTVEIPILGSVTAKGLKPIELQDVIRSRVSRLYKDPVVVCTLNGRVVFLGGGGPNGVVPITNNRLTILEAFAQVGNPSLTSKRDKVWVIREVDGIREYNRVNLNSKNIFTSKFYYLRNNDLIYVEPGTVEAFIGVNNPTRNLIAIGTGSLGIILSLVAIFAN